jgi:tRNA (cmo5U34)-methyltransferase
VVDVRKLDLRERFPDERASVVLSVLTLQFTPLEYRTRIVRRVWEALRPGGAFLLVEKVFGTQPDAWFDIVRMASLAFWDAWLKQRRRRRSGWHPTL